MKLAIAITHATFAPERAATLERLTTQLPVGIPIRVLASDQPEPTRVWARRLWDFVASGSDVDAEWTICLQDDDEVFPQIDKAVEAIIDSVGHLAGMVSLHTALPAARDLMPGGPGPHPPSAWLRSHWLTAPGYLLSRRTAKALCEYADKLPAKWYADQGEDVIANQYAWTHTGPIWSTVPALVKHDESVPSLLGHDAHKLRTATVTWEDLEDPSVLTTPEYWTPRKGPMPFVENPWATERALAATQHDLDRGRYPGLCWFCDVNSSAVCSAKTGNGICGPCIQACVNMIVGSDIRGIVRGGPQPAETGATP